MHNNLVVSVVSEVWYYWRGFLARATDTGLRGRVMVACSSNCWVGR